MKQADVVTPKLRYSKSHNISFQKVTGKKKTENAIKQCWQPPQQSTVFLMCLSNH